MNEKQVDIRGSFRVLHETPGHATYGVWVNGGKSGDLVVRQEERIAFQSMMERAGFELRPDIGGFEPRIKGERNPETGQFEVAHWPKPRVSNPDFLTEELASYEASLNPRNSR